MDRKVIVLCCFLALASAIALFAGKMYRSYNTRSNPVQVSAYAGAVAGGTLDECMITVRSNLQVSIKLDSLTVVTKNHQMLNVLNNQGFQPIKLSRFGRYTVRVAIITKR